MQQPAPDTYSIGYRPYEHRHTLISNRTGFVLSFHPTHRDAVTEARRLIALARLARACTAEETG